MLSWTQNHPPISGAVRSISAVSRGEALLHLGAQCELSVEVAIREGLGPGVLIVVP